MGAGAMYVSVDATTDVKRFVLEVELYPKEYPFEKSALLALPLTKVVMPPNIGKVLCADQFDINEIT